MTVIPNIFNSLLLYRAAQSPRRSPRLSARSSSATAVAPSMDVFLFQVTNTTKGDPRLSKTTTLIHSVATDASLADLKALVRAHESEGIMYVPAKGLFWLRKGTKQLVELKSEADFQNCKTEYSKGGKPPTGIRIACLSVNLDAGW